MVVEQDGIIRHINSLPDRTDTNQLPSADQITRPAGQPVADTPSIARHSVINACQQPLPATIDESTATRPMPLTPMAD